jgi:hypothetical protein
VSESEQRDKRLDNLKPFEKGQSGNPGGRPKGSVTALWRKLVDEVDPDDEGGRTRGEVLFHAAYETARARGRASNLAIRLIVDRVEGKPPQSVTLTMDTRERLETAVSKVMELESCSRPEAIAAVALFEPLANELLN